MIELITLAVGIVAIAFAVFAIIWELSHPAELPLRSREARAATGPTQRLACCARPDYPDGAACCINCGKAVTR